jgi:very-short-patch-repair endonuclease
MAALIDAAIAAVAAKQFGNITRLQLLSLGLTSDGITHRVRTGRLFRIYAGVYAVGRPPQLPLERAMAAVLACGPGAGLSHGWAMTSWGFWRRWVDPIEVTITKGDRRPTGIRVHRSRTLTAEDIVIQNGIPTTSSARTIADIAPRRNDKQLARDVNEALHSRFLTRGQLAAYLRRHPDKRLGYFVTAEGGPTRSDWERELPAFLDAFEIPRPIPNAPVAGYRVDALWPAEKLILEQDSWGFHSTRIDFETDRERDAATLLAGYATVRLTWERMIGTPAREADRLKRILASRRRQAA